MNYQYGEYRRKNQFTLSQAKLNPFRQPEVPNPPQDTVSKLSWCPTKPILCASSWDCSVSSWEVRLDHNETKSKPLIRIYHEAPALCVCCTLDGKVYSGGCDNLSKVTALPGVNISRGNTTSYIFGMHQNCIKTIHHDHLRKSVITGGWDKKLRFWDERHSSNYKCVNEVDLPERVYCADIDAERNLYVACCGGSDKLVVCYDLRNSQRVLRSDKSKLRHITRSVAIFPDGKGYVIGSIEGRCSVFHFGDRDGSGTNRKTFSFKCHRENRSNNLRGGRSKTECFAVNDISFHKGYGTFATVGSNGRFNFWNMYQRTRTFHGRKKFSMPLTCGQFSPSLNGKVFAIAVGYDFTKGTDVDVFKKGVGPRIILQSSLRDMHNAR